MTALSERDRIVAEERYIRMELKRLHLQHLPEHKKAQLLELGLFSERSDWVQAGYEKWKAIRSG